MNTIILVHAFISRLNHLPARIMWFYNYNVCAYSAEEKNYNFQVDGTIFLDPKS